MLIAIRFLAKTLFYIAVAGGMFMTALVFTSTLMRYLLGSPITFSDELAGLLFFSGAFLALPYVLLENKHVSIDFMTKVSSIKLRKASSLVASLTTATFAFIFIYQSWDFMAFSYQIQSKSEISGILLWPWMALMPLSLGLCIIIQLMNHFSLFQHKDR